MIDASQPGNGFCEFCVLLAMLLAGRGNVLLYYWDGFGVPPLAVELADLRTERSKVVGLLRSHLHRPRARQGRNQPNKHDCAPRPTHRHYTFSAIE
jgi:hypothetical protein